MISFIVRQSIRYPGVVVALALTVVLYGLYVLTRANLDVFPEFSPSQVVIQTEAPGLSAELVETAGHAAIENALAGATGVESTSVRRSIPGLSVVTVLFREAPASYRNRQVVSERLASLANQLPHGVAQPAMTPLTSSASTVLGVGLTSNDALADGDPHAGGLDGAAASAGGGGRGRGERVRRRGAAVAGAGRSRAADALRPVDAGRGAGRAPRDRRAAGTGSCEPTTST